MVFSWAQPKKKPHAPKEKMPQDYFLSTRTGGDGLTLSGQRGVFLIHKMGLSLLHDAVCG